MKTVLDTNVLSELMKPQGSRKVKNWVATQPSDRFSYKSALSPKGNPFEYAIARVKVLLISNPWVYISIQNINQNTRKHDNCPEKD
jgi:hypothetical protein